MSYGKDVCHPSYNIVSCLAEAFFVWHQVVGDQCGKGGTSLSAMIDGGQPWRRATLYFCISVFFIFLFFYLFLSLCIFILIDGSQPWRRSTLYFHVSIYFCLFVFLFLVMIGGYQPKCGTIIGNLSFLVNLLRGIISIFDTDTVLLKGLH